MEKETKKRNPETMKLQVLLRSVLFALVALLLLAGPVSSQRQSAQAEQDQGLRGQQPAAAVDETVTVSSGCARDNCNACSSTATCASAANPSGKSLAACVWKFSEGYSTDHVPHCARGVVGQDTKTPASGKANGL